MPNPARRVAVLRSLFRLRLVAVLTLSLMVSAGCSKFQRVLKSDSVDEKYKAAVAYYDEGRYEKSTIILEELLPLLRGRPEAEKAAYLFAQGEFKQQYYELASFQFRSFVETYPRSAFSEEVSFLYVKAQYLSSPKFDLDQSTTTTALEAIRDFQVRYPDSPYRQQAQEFSEELTAKLEKKAFESAKLYYNLRYYQSGVTALTTFLKEYPGSRFSEEATFLRVSAQHDLGVHSVPDKQRERYLEAVAFYQGLVDAYPQSKYLKLAESFYDNAQRQLQKLNKDQPEAKK